MKRVRFLHGANQRGKSPLLPLDPRRWAHRDPFRTDWRIVSLLALVILIGIARVIRMYQGEYWWLIPLTPAVFAGVTIAYRVSMRSVKREVERKLRQSAMNDTHVNPP